MAKADMLCPFTHKLCDECILFRGRHYFLCFAKNYGGNMGKSNGHGNSNFIKNAVDLKRLDRLAGPWESDGYELEAEMNMQLKIVDMETGEERTCRLEEAKDWDWTNSKMNRMVAGIQVTSFEKLLEIARYRSRKGLKEIEIFETPLFMLLAGG